jgi:ABC-type sulfate transport system permease component
MIAPFLGYYLLLQTGFRGAAWIAAGLLILSTFCFLAVRKNNRLNPRLVQET